MEKDWISASEPASALLFPHIQDAVDGLQIPRKPQAVYLPVAHRRGHGHFPEFLPLRDVRDMDFHLGHRDAGKGAAFVRTKLKNIKSSGVIEKSFRPTEKFPQARIDRKDLQYLYSDGDLYYFMDTESYEQIALNSDAVGDALKFVKENEMCKICSHNGSVYSVEPPLFVELEITDTEPGFKGDTATGASKPATVETGAQVFVPLFVNQGDKIKIDTRTGEYLSRV